jgi:hypothetical protein
MPAKLRTAKGRAFVATPAMCDLFTRGRRLQKQIDGLKDQLGDVERQLHKLCGLLPWDTGPLTVCDVLHWPRAGNLQDQSAPQVLAIKKAIEAALEEAKPRKKPAGEPVDLE